MKPNPEKPKFTRDQYAFIGRVAALQDDPIVNEIINKVLKREKTKSDIRKVTDLHTPGMDRRLFIGVVLLSIHRDIDSFKGKFQLQRGLVTDISKVLAMPHSNVSVMIREVILGLKVYPEFRNRVEAYLETQNTLNKSRSDDEAKNKE